MKIVLIDEKRRVSDEDIQTFQDVIGFCEDSGIHLNSESQSPIVLIAHANNPEMGKKVEKVPLGSEMTFLDFIATKVCEYGGRVVVFSEGSIREERKSSILKIMEKNEYEEGRHFYLLEGANLRRSIDWSLLSKKDILASDWRIEESILWQHDRLLQNVHAMCILCQGYLAICSVDKINNTKDVSFPSSSTSRALDRMGWNELPKEIIADILQVDVSASGISTVEKINQKSWWEVLNKDEIIKFCHRNWEKEETWLSIMQLLNQTSSDSDKLNINCEMVANAYLTLLEKV